MDSVLYFLYGFCIYGLLFYKYKTGVDCLPEHLKWKIHNDWTFPFKCIPRFFTSYKLFLPRLLWGYNVNCWIDVEGIHCPEPIQRELCGKWCSCAITFPLCFTITIWTGYYLYFGFRWDSVDNYYTFPAVDISKAERFMR